MGQKRIDTENSWEAVTAVQEGSAEGLDEGSVGKGRREAVYLAVTKGRINQAEYYCGMQKHRLDFDLHLIAAWSQGPESL